MARYAILIYAKNSPDNDTDTETDTTEARDAHGRHADDLIASGAMVAAFALLPADTTATSIRDDVVTDGPFIDAKEVVAGLPRTRRSASSWRSASQVLDQCPLSQGPVGAYQRQPH